MTRRAAAARIISSKYDLSQTYLSSYVPSKHYHLLQYGRKYFPGRDLVATNDYTDCLSSIRTKENCNNYACGWTLLTPLRQPQAPNRQLVSSIYTLLFYAHSTYWVAGMSHSRAVPTRRSGVRLGGAPVSGF